MAIYEAPKPASTSGGGFAKGIGQALDALTEAKAHKAYQKHTMATQWEQTQKELQYKQALEQKQKQFLSGLQQQQTKEKAKALAPYVNNDIDLAEYLISNPKVAAAHFGEHGFQKAGNNEPEPSSADFMQALMRKEESQPQQQEFAPPAAEQPFNEQDALMRAAQESGFKPPQPQQVQKPAAPLTKQSLAARNLAIANEEPWQTLSGPKPKNNIQKTAFTRAHERQKEIDKEVAPFIETLDKKGGTVAKQTYPILNRLDRLIDEGGLTKAKEYNAYKNMEQNGEKIWGGYLGSLGTVAGAVIGGVAGGVAGGVGGSAIPLLGNVGGAISGALSGAATGAHIVGSAGQRIGAGIGANYPKFVGTKADQEFQKLTTSFMDKMKDAFGGRILETEVKWFMDSIPALSQTKAGKRAIIRNLRLTLDGWVHMKNTKDTIKKEYGGYYPSNIEQLVEQRSKPYMDKIASKLVEGLPEKKKKVDQQSKFTKIFPTTPAHVAQLLKGG